MALTDLAAVIFTVHVMPDVESQPLQLSKMESKPGVAVSVTTVPLS